jgi:predicted enzyme related to lactoylglutathione lyase
MSFGRRGGRYWRVPMHERSRPVVHLELHTPELALATAFYAAACGWRSEPVNVGGGSYLTLDLGGQGGGGGVVECPIDQPIWLPYVQVPEIAQATERARRLGADVLLEPREGPAGWRSVVSASGAGEIAFWQSKLGPSEPDDEDG